MRITKGTRWRVFAGVWIQSLFTSATAYFSLFALPLTGQFGWSQSDFSMAYTIYMFVYCLMGFVGGILAEKLKPMVAIYIGLAFFAAGWFLTGFAETIPQLYIFYGILAGAGAGTIYPACLPTALKWFPDKSGSISGLVQAGASCGPFIMSPIAQILIDNYGAQMTCRILAVVFLIGIGAVAWMIVPCPEGWLPEGWKPSEEQAKVLNTKNYNIPGMVNLINGISMIMLTFANNLPYFIVCICLVGFSFGGLLVVFAPIVKNVFGSKFYNRNYGLIFIGYGIGAFVGPKISASFYDSTNSYVMGYIGSAILAAAAIVLVFIAKKLVAKMQEKNG